MGASIGLLVGAGGVVGTAIGLPEGAGGVVGPTIGLADGLLTGDKVGTFSTEVQLVESTLLLMKFFEV
jgi:hypothetical protein